VQIPPDNWIPRAQDASGDGRFSIYLPPPHELVEPLHVPDGPYAIAATPEEGSPQVVPPQPDLSPSPPPHIYVPPPPPDLAPSRGRQRYPRERDYAYAPPPPDLGPPTAPPNRPPSRTRDYAPPPPPPDLHRIAKVESRASTHLSEFDLLAPVDQEVGEPAEEEEELEYVDAPTEPIPRRPIAPNPPLQRRRATYQRPGPRPPRQIILPAPLAPPPPPPLVPQSYVYPQQQQVQQDSTDDDLVYEDENEDSPVLAQMPSERNRPHRSRTQSSGVIGISVEPPVRTFSPLSFLHS
jgi:hypothetical protein